MTTANGKKLWSAKSFAALALALMIVALFSACSFPRGPGSKPVPPPVDPLREEWEKKFDEVKALQAQLPNKRDYYIGPGDVISITLVGRSDIFGKNETGREVFEYTVTENPTVTLPYVGAVQVHGKTPMELQEEVKKAYASQIKDPMPIVTVDKFYFNQVTVLGSVRVPGKYSLEAGDTVLEGIFKAGGLTFGGGANGLPPAPILKIYRDKLGQKDRLVLTPEEIMNQLEDKGEIETREEIILPLERFIMGGNLAYNIPLAPNDIVYVPPAGTVVVHGDAKQPRVVFLGPGLRNLSQVITETGGLRFRAASQVEVVRTQPDGTTETFFRDVRQVMRRRIPDFTLQDNDQIFIYTHPIRNIVDVLGSVFRATATTGVNATYSPVP